MRKVNIRIQSRQLNRLAYSLSQKYSNIKQVNAEALDAVTKDILAKSLAEVPVDTSTLASIGGTTDVQIGGTIISTKVGYGLEGKDAYNPKSESFATDYMMEVHEDLTKVHPNGGKAKFLEDPVNEAKPRLIEALKEATKKAL